MRAEVFLWRNEPILFCRCPLARASTLHRDRAEARHPPQSLQRRNCLPPRVPLAPLRKTRLSCIRHAASNDRSQMRRALNNLNADLAGSTGHPLLMGSTGNLPVPVGNLPIGTESNATQGRTTLSSPHATPIPSGKLPAGAGESPAPTIPDPFPDYVCRVTSDDGDIGRGNLAAFRTWNAARPSCSPPAHVQKRRTRARRRFHERIQANHRARQAAVR